MIWSLKQETKNSWGGSVAGQEKAERPNSKIRGQWYHWEKLQIGVSMKEFDCKIWFFLSSETYLNLQVVI